MSRFVIPTALLALAVPLAACGGFDCNFPDYEFVEDTLILRAEPEPSDTLTVVFELEEGGVAQNVWVGLGAQTPGVSSTSQSEVVLRAEFSDYEAERVPPLSAQAAGDTLFVVPSAFAETLAAAPLCAQGDGIVQPVCSLAPPNLQLFVIGTNAPEGVRAVRYLTRDASGRLAPLRSAPQTDAPARTARG